MLTAVLLGLPYMPWRPLVDRKGGANIDWMPDAYQKYIADHPLPPIERFPTRTGESLVIRIYKSTTADDDKTRNVVLHHGGAVDSTSVHPLALELQKRGINVYIPDVRDHGESATNGLGQLGYKWQNLDDLEDLLNHFELPPATTVFAGHSAQGGGAWYLASQDRWRKCFAGFVSIAGGIASEPDFFKEECFSNYLQIHLPRLNALMILNA